MNDLVIRRATLDDIQGIYDVMVDTLYIQAFYGGRSFEAVRNEMIAKFFAENVFAFVACDGDKIIGYCIFAPYAKYFNPDKGLPDRVEFAGKTYDLRGYAYSLGTGVLESLRGKRIGFALRQFVDAQMKKEGFSGIVTDCNPENTRSIKNQINVGMIKVAEVPCKRSPTRPSGINTIWIKPF